MEKSKQFDLAVATIAVLSLVSALIVGFKGTEAIEAERHRMEKIEASLNVLTQGQYETVTMEELGKMNEQIKAVRQQPSQTSQSATQP